MLLLTLKSKTMSDQFTTDHIQALLSGMKLPATIKLNQAETVIDVLQYISTQCTRMQCGCRILEQQAAERMAAMAEQLTNQQ